MHTRTARTLTVSAIGMGAMPLTMRAEKPHLSDAEAIRTIHAALDAGIRFIDTADDYTGSHAWNENERLVAAALRDWSGAVDEIVVSTKGGFIREPQLIGERIDKGGWGMNGTPDYLIGACESSLRALGTDAIDLYFLHTPDPKVPLEDSLGALVTLFDAGKVRSVGVSNVTDEQVEVAASILGERLVAVQHRFSPGFQRYRSMIDRCQELGLLFMPYQPLGGVLQAHEFGSKYLPFATIADDHGVSPQQVCLAWELAISENVVPIPGSSRPATVLDSIAATELSLSDDEFARLEASAAVRVR